MADYAQPSHALPGQRTLTKQPLGVVAVPTVACTSAVAPAAIVHDGDEQLRFGLRIVEAVMRRRGV